MNELSIQRTVDLLGDSPITGYRVIYDGDIFTFEDIKQRINTVLDSAPDSDQQAAALRMHADELMARVKCESMAGHKLTASFKLEFASVVSRLMGASL